ncbi:PRC domain containing protein [Kitasatospora sp. MMS16-BH015]|uniref:PRC-barrel domain-containing protein n=1 Tax=Kitasatospora sp. MMS16-BH015 TaxID=2018025 RepID=UPI000CA15D72|nr:PRC-barrel domain-containing protein [Kitasatospora sp. MMS16-BH015]AUG75598.1 PRC domain containing protein [Kitasatospora sp. MMS16-BH015]
MSGEQIWDYRPTTGYVPGSDLAGFHVEATDGHIGKVHKHSHEVGSTYLVVDTGPWIFGKYVLLPAATVQRVDHEEQKIYVDRTKDEIKNGPDYDQGAHEEDPEYRERYGSYYGPFYGGPIV